MMELAPHFLRRMSPEFYHESEQWPAFRWNEARVQELLGKVRFRQGQLLGMMEQLEPAEKREAIILALGQEAICSAAIETDEFNLEELKSAVARCLKIRIPGMVPSSGMANGLAKLVTEAARHQDKKYTADLFYAWHSDLFPTSPGHAFRFLTGKWRNSPLSVISAENDTQRVHFIAPAPDRIGAEMKKLLHWLNHSEGYDDVVRSAIAHLWFLTIHPFEDGNGQMARALTLSMLQRSEGMLPRYYALSARLLEKRSEYFGELEAAQRGNGDITSWLIWFMQNLLQSLDAMPVLQGGIIRQHELSEKMNRESLKPRQKSIIRSLQQAGHAHFTSTLYASAGKISQDTAIRDLRMLMNRGIVQKLPGGGRSTRYKLKKQ